MFIKNFKGDLYIGRKAGVELSKTLSKAKRKVRIVSPFVSNKNLLQLLKLHNKGVEVEIYYSSESTNFTDYFKTTFLNKHSSTRTILLIFFSIVIFTCGVLSYLSYNKLIELSEYQIYFTAGVVLSMVLLFINHKFNVSKYSPKIPMKVYDSYHMKYLVHSKIYIIDDEIAFLGSLNFTNKGFYQNHEIVLKTVNKDDLQKISRVIDDVADRLKEKNISEVARNI